CIFTLGRQFQIPKRQSLGDVPLSCLVDAIVLDFVEEGMIFCFSDYNEILYGSFCKDYDYKEC
ncbi:hypothetical protein POZ14_15370, partial [Phocaeicola vulgatus]|nr:hypothetical protein [Phocaeicola vulgatus]